MEGKKPAAGSIVDELFGPKDGDNKSPSSAGYFSTVFPPPSAVMGKDASRRTHDGKGQGSSSKGQYTVGGSKDTRRTGTAYANEPAESPYFGSSVHYGGRDFYGGSQATLDNETAKNYKTDDKDGSAATRGDWWQGSLYY